MHTIYDTYTLYIKTYSARNIFTTNYSQAKFLNKILL